MFPYDILLVRPWSRQIFSSVGFDRQAFYAALISQENVCQCGHTLVRPFSSYVSLVTVLMLKSKSKVAVFKSTTSLGLLSQLNL